MMNRFSLLLLFSGLALAQDCSITLSGRTATGPTPAFDNRGIGCLNWTLEYFAQGFTAVSVQLEGAPDANGTPGTFAAIAGIALNSALQGSSDYTGFYPWVRLNVTALTGTGSLGALAFGQKPATAVPSIQPTGGGGGGGTAGVCQSTNLNVPIAPPAGLFSTGLTQLIAPVPGKSIILCNLLLAFNGGVNLQIEYGTGVACATGTAAVTGIMPNVQTYASDAPTALPVGQGACASVNTSVIGGGLLVYALQ